MIKSRHRTTPIVALPVLKERPPDAHKGTFGKVYVLAGSVGMTGAAALTCQAVLRSGAGMCTLGIAEGLYSIMEVKLTCTMVEPLPENDEHGLSMAAVEPIRKSLARHTVLAVGPGLGQQRETQAVVIQTLERNPQAPLVIDADGINILSKNREALRNCRDRAILTPHVGEMARLLGANDAAVESDRQNAAQGFAQRFRLVVVLKGRHTLVSDGDRLYTNRTGNSGMATAGSGDVLTGIIAGLRAQGYPDFDAACLGVHLHGLAGDLAALRVGEDSLIATDIVDALPQAIRRFRAGQGAALMDLEPQFSLEEPRPTAPRSPLRDSQSGSAS